MFIKVLWLKHKLYFSFIFVQMLFTEKKDNNTD